MPGEPTLNLGMLVRSVVVHDQMQVQGRIGGGIDPFEKLDPFLVSMSRHALANYYSLSHVQSREQSSGAMTHVIVGQSAATAGHHGQAFLRAIERLNLTLLTAT